VPPGPVALPVGTVTFLLTDVEGSARLWEQHAAQMRQALIRHDAIIETLTERHRGAVVRPRGDGSRQGCVFARAGDAVAAAAAIQRALRDEPWPPDTPLRVRVALHTGEADLRDGDYFGSAVYRCARLRGAAHGGQTLLSVATEALVRDSLPPEVSLHDLGVHRINDPARPERVFQAIAPGLPHQFPPLRPLDALPNNLPAQATPFIGREADVEAVCRLLPSRDVRLLTLTGPGGVGKTRLSLEVAAALAPDFPDGVFQVQLAPVSDPELLRAAIAHALGLRDAGGRPIAETLTDYLRPRQTLLVLDNFEQLLRPRGGSAAPAVGALLAACSALKLLVTSREVLRVYGEHEYPVPPLALPDAGEVAPERLARSAAARLFVDRATSVRPGFAVDERNAPALAAICRRLDGLPLALELAAARVRLFPLPALLERLERRLPLLTGGARDLPARHQTLRGALAWSYDLLEPGEQRLFRRLGVFVGGFTLEAAEAVCAAEAATGAVAGTEVQEGVDALLGKSLLLRDEAGDGASRLFMLETVREYALEQLRLAGEAPRAHARHREWCVALAERAEPALLGPEQAVWFQRLERELGNVRGALAWSVERREAEPGLRLASALWTFWYVRGYLRESVRWLDALLSLEADVTPATRANALRVLGSQAAYAQDFERAEGLQRQALELFQQLGDAGGAARTLEHLSTTVARGRGELDEADAICAQGLDLCRRLGDVHGTALALMHFGELAQGRGALPRAVEHLEESLALFRRCGDRRRAARALTMLSRLARAAGDRQRAAGLCTEGLATFRELAFRPGIGDCLEALTDLGLDAGQAAHAARLLAATESLRAVASTSGHSAPPATHQRRVAAARAGLDDAAFAAAWAEGSAMDFDAAAAYALDHHSKAQAATPRPVAAAVPAALAVFTPREREVLGHLARGLSNRQIADALVVTVRTAEKHVDNVIGKLGLASRAQVAVWAAAQRLPEAPGIPDLRSPTA
jgi:predicted ATPase/class 3 adenylate cyclase/DNA-binding NarL/FixJ family response regulator